MNNIEGGFFGIDLHSVLGNLMEKLGFSTTGRVPEMHIKVPFQEPYNFAGPATILEDNGKYEGRLNYDESDGMTDYDYTWKS